MHELPKFVTHEVLEPKTELCEQEDRRGQCGQIAQDGQERGS